MIVKITDEPKARTRRKTLNYIKEGNILRHISKYAMDEIKTGDEKAWEITYDVPMERIQGKEAYEFGFSNSGGFGVSKFSSELFNEKHNNWKRVSVEELQSLEFEIESKELKVFIEEEIMKFYAPMITEIDRFKVKVDMDHIVTSDRLGDYLIDFRYGLASSLCNWPEKARLRSLKQTSRLLHKLWALKVIHEALQAVKVESGWYTEQGSKRPASIFIDNQGNYWSCWFEPQIVKEAPPNYEGPFAPFLGEKTVWKRPDLLISKGKYNSFADAPKFDFLIKCKNSHFNYWWDGGKVIKKVLLPYKTLFNPEKLIIASLEPIPDWEKDRLEKEDFLVVDELYPEGRGVPEFKRLIEQ